MHPARATILQGHSCVCCGESRLSELELDHEDGGGNRHRRHLYPLSLEQRLAQVGSTTQVDGHRITVRCKACHRSKTKYGSCMIDHQRADNAETSQDDSPSAASTIPTKLMRGQKRELAATVQFSARVSPELKKRIDRWTNYGEFTYPEALEHMLDELESDATKHHREVMAHLKDHQTILTNLGTTLTKIFMLLTEHGPAPADSSVTAPDDFSYLDPARPPVVASTPPPMIEVPPPPSRWRRLLRWLWTY